MAAPSHLHGLTDNNIDPQFQHEQVSGFTCAHCQAHVQVTPYMGTANRNHCNICLYSRHVDISKGDRQSVCGGEMKPVGLTFKHEGRGKLGEIMLIHECQACQHLSINRIARDDGEQQIVDVFIDSASLSPQTRDRILAQHIYVANESDRREIMAQLFGAMS